MAFHPDIHHRQSIRLRGYDYAQLGAYYVTICTNERVHLFGEVVGAALCGRPGNPDQMMEKWLIEIQNAFPGAEIVKYVIMPDHIHFILFREGGHAEPPLPKIVEWFKTMTTNEYIRGVKSGLYPTFNKRVWQRGYYEHVIRDEDDYRAKWNYIDENLTRWSDRQITSCNAP